MMKGIEATRVSPIDLNKTNPFQEDVKHYVKNGEVLTVPKNTNVPLTLETSIDAGKHFGWFLDAPWIACLFAVCPPASIAAVYGTHLKSLALLGVAMTILCVNAAAVHIIASRDKNLSNFAQFITSAIIILSIAACMVLTWALVRLKSVINKHSSSTITDSSVGTSVNPRIGSNMVKATTTTTESVGGMHIPSDLAIASVYSPLDSIARYVPSFILFVTFNFIPALVSTLAAEKNLILLSMVALIFDVVSLVISGIGVRQAIKLLPGTPNRFWKILFRWWVLGGTIAALPFILYQIWGFLKFERKKKFLQNPVPPRMIGGEVASANVMESNA